MIRLFSYIALVLGSLALLAVIFAKDTAYRSASLYGCAGEAQWDAAFDSSFISDCVQGLYGSEEDAGTPDAQACAADFISGCMDGHGYEMIPKDSCTESEYGAYDIFCWRKIEAPPERRMPFYPERK